MATRTIITIDEETCNGCGNCITGCAEGALQLVNGKAKLVKEQFCDGFGDCIGTCPTGALTLVEREVPEFDPDLQQWPVQLHLVQPGAPFFKNKEMAILSTCSPIASADVHWRFMRGRSIVVACPKLDRTEPYAGKLSQIFQEPTIPKALIVRMEVPCCGGLTRIVQEAHRLSGRRDLVIEEVTVGLDGTVVSSHILDL